MITLLIVFGLLLTGICIVGYIDISIDKQLAREERNRKIDDYKRKEAALKQNIIEQ